MTTRINEAKATVKPISYKRKFISTTCISNKKWNNEKYQCECNIYHIYGWNPSICIYENGKYLKNITDYSKIVFNGIICLIDIVSSASTNSHGKNVKI